MIERVTTTNIELLALKWGGDVINQVTAGGVIPRLVFNRKKGQVADMYVKCLAAGQLRLCHKGI